MQPRTLLRLALLAVLIAGASPTTAALALRNDGVVFPDGSVQTTAGQAGQPIQARQPATIASPSTCSPWTTLYSVPASSRLLVEWMSIEIRVHADLVIDVDLRTHDATGSIDHALIRLSDPAVIALNPFASQRWSSTVQLHSTGGQPVQFRACHNTEVEDSAVLVSFSGQLFDVAP